MRLGLALGGAADAGGWERALARAERADALGLHSLWLPEGHFARGAMASPLIALSAFAARTERVKLATTSLLLPIHHPLRLAAEIATLDTLSGGRVICGLGRGFRSPVFAGFGVAARSKRDRFDEALDALLDAWAGKPMDLSDTHFGSEQGAPVSLGLRPVQEPHPPLVVAAFGRKGLLQAAHRGLPYLASPLETLDTLEENYALWREERVPADVPAAAEVPVMRTVHVAADRAAAERVLLALDEERERLLRLGPKAPPALVRAASGRVEDRVLVGTAAEVAERIEIYRERLGMDLLVVRSEVPGVPPEAQDESLERLATEVLPQ